MEKNDISTKLQYLLYDSDSIHYQNMTHSAIKDILQIITDETSDTSYVFNYWVNCVTGCARQHCVAEIFAEAQKMINGGSINANKIIQWVSDYYLIGV